MQLQIDQVDYIIDDTYNKNKIDMEKKMPFTERDSIDFIRQAIEAVLTSAKEKLVQIEDISVLKACLMSLDEIPTKDEQKKLKFEEAIRVVYYPKGKVPRPESLDKLTTLSIDYAELQKAFDKKIGELISVESQRAEEVQLATEAKQAEAAKAIQDHAKKCIDKFSTKISCIYDALIQSVKEDKTAGKYHPKTLDDAGILIKYSKSILESYSSEKITQAPDVIDVNKLMGDCKDKCLEAVDSAQEVFKQEVFTKDISVFYRLSNFYIQIRKEIEGMNNKFLWKKEVIPINANESMPTKRFRALQQAVKELNPAAEEALPIHKL